jgi:HPt (histidine-containing phosphotransfer) domain-containing protein
MAMEGPPVRSRLASNRRLRPAVRKFAGRLAEQMAAFEQAYSASDFTQLAQLGHWLKGAAGTVGYDDFTEPAMRLEDAARDGDLRDLGAAMAALRDLTARLEVPPEDEIVAVES